MKFPNIMNKTFISGWYDKRKDTTIREMAETMKLAVYFKVKPIFDAPKVSLKSSWTKFVLEALKKILN